jgi:ClpP class serine protease
VWRGADGLELGLVDATGGAWRAVEIAKRLAKIKDRYAMPPCGEDKRSRHRAPAEENGMLIPLSGPGRDSPRGLSLMLGPWCAPLFMIQARCED